jgi:thioredoxin reductase
MSNKCNVVVVGAGPYGLATSAHLISAGLDIRTFGGVMDFWKERMPHGMKLRSSWEASHIADPDHALTLNSFEQKSDVNIPRPIPLEDFIAYGEWFNQQVAPDLDERRVSMVECAKQGFNVTLDDGEIVETERVVVAAGISRYAYRPSQFDRLPRELATHSSEERDFSQFRDRRVVVVGGGQSAIESAALLQEAGAEVELVVRANTIHWLTRTTRIRDSLGPARPLLYPWTDVGPPGLNWIVATPDLFRRFPLELQRRIARRSIRPAGADWLVPRVHGVTFTIGRTIRSVEQTAGSVHLTLDDQSERFADHLLLATGYQVNVTKLPFLSDSVVSSLRLRLGYPILTSGFESSIPGLHFVGAAAAESFGPLMRFVSGTRYSARALKRKIHDGERPPVRIGSDEREAAVDRPMVETRS